MRELLVRHLGTIGFVILLAGFTAGVVLENHFVSPGLLEALILRGFQVLPVIVVGVWARMQSSREPRKKRVQAFWGCVGVAVIEIAFGVFLRLNVQFDHSAPRMESFPIIGVQVEKTYTPRSGKSVQRSPGVGAIAYILISVDGKTRKVKNDWLGAVEPGRDRLVRTIRDGAFGVPWLEKAEIKKFEEARR